MDGRIERRVRRPSGVAPTRANQRELKYRYGGVGVGHLEGHRGAVVEASGRVLAYRESTGAEQLRDTMFSVGVPKPMSTKGQGPPPWGRKSVGVRVMESSELPGWVSV